MTTITILRVIPVSDDVTPSRDIFQHVLVGRKFEGRAEWSPAPWRSGCSTALPAGTAAWTPVLISGTITSLPGFLGSTGSLMSDPEISDADTPSSSALTCQIIRLAVLEL